MHKFKDAEGRDWPIELTIGAARRLKGELNLDLLNAAAGGNDSAIVKLTVDVEVIVDALHLLCRRQCEERDVDAMAFAELLSGDVFAEAWEALRAEVADFTQRLRKPHVSAALDKTRAMVDEAERRGIDKLQNLNPDETETDGRSSTSSPDSSGSSPTP